MFEVGDILILKEMQRSSDKYTETSLSEKLLMVVAFNTTPYEYYLVEFPFTTSSNVLNNKLNRSREFLEAYYEVYRQRS